ncbi:MAG: SUMF1/EgtB/PvdO family nonheme iron enzyme, partial [Coraliomargarita sp.]
TVMYTRWDYSDMVHSNNRPLMVMRPDGSGQKALALSNSYFPNAFFFARPIPGKPSQVVGIASGHHEGRNGKLLILDTEVGHKEEEGFIHQIPGYGEKVERVVRDPLNYKVTNQMMHPYPLAEKGTNKGAGEFFLAYKNGGIYLVDIYDNQLLIYRENGCSVREPIPFEARETPPVLASSIKPESDTATLYIQNLYHGPGLKGVPRGTIRKLRIGAYQFSPRHSGGGHLGLIGVDSGWDIKKVIGEVPVEEDGSVNCEIPSKTPLFFQPLDENGRTLQGMRTWVSAMGGEFMSCVGCHESPNDAPPPGMALAMHRAPSKIEPWQGKSRPMSFRHEIQPILDAKCISCHDAEPANGRYQTTRPEYADGIPDLRGTEMKKLPLRILGSTGDIPFSLAYWNLMPHVYRPGIESPMDVPTPGEYGAVTSELTQILRKGHHGVVLSDAEWGRFNTWMDFNAPYYGYRREIMSVCPDGRSEGAEAMERAITRGNELAQCYAGIDAFVDLDSPEPEQRETLPIPDQKAIAAKRASGTVPFNASVNQSRLEPIELKLSGSEKIELVPIPAGRFVMGSANGELDELPMHENVIKKPFYMASKEISNAQFRLFMKEHNSGFVDRLGFQFGQECVPVNGDELPAVRVSWVMAMEFCEWLSNKTGKKVSLPTEAQWEWAARAGQDGEFWFGNQSSDFAPYANLADKTMEHFAECTSQGGYKMIRILKDPNENEMWIPHTKAVNDGQRVQCAPGHYKPNPWGLYDMHGNVSEWTRSAYQPYPYQDSDDVSDVKIERVVRGGSYRDRPYRATASHRQMYRGWHRVHDVGFRVIVEQE